MNKHLWTFNEKGTVCIENDANDYYYEWLSLDVGGMTIKELFEQYLDVSFVKTRIRVKARQGAIFIVLAGDKDDT